MDDVEEVEESNREVSGRRRRKRTRRGGGIEAEKRSR